VCDELPFEVLFSVNVLCNAENRIHAALLVLRGMRLALSQILRSPISTSNSSLALLPTL